MSEIPTIPPRKPIRMPPKPDRRPIIDDSRPVPGVPRQAPIRPPAASSPEIQVAAHGERLNGIERRLERVEDGFETIDHKLDQVHETLQKEITDRKLEKAVKEDEKLKEDQKTRRFQALLTALPIILAPILGVVTTILMRDTPPTPASNVQISQYQHEADDCQVQHKEKSAFELCIRQAQLRNTPVFRP